MRDRHPVRRPVPTSESRCIPLPSATNDHRVVISWSDQTSHFDGHRCSVNITSGRLSRRHFCHPVPGEMEVRCKNMRFLRQPPAGRFVTERRATDYEVDPSDHCEGRPLASVRQPRSSPARLAAACAGSPPGGCSTTAPMSCLPASSSTAGHCAAMALGSRLRTRPGSARAVRHRTDPVQPAVADTQGGAPCAVEV